MCPHRPHVYVYSHLCSLSDLRDKQIVSSLTSMPQQSDFSWQEDAPVITRHVKVEKQTLDDLH